MENLISKVRAFIDLYNNLEAMWLDRLKKNNVKTMNFNRIKIHDIDLGIYDYIFEYRKFLAYYNPYLNDILGRQSIDRTRVKETLSIKQKIKKYDTNSLNGSVIMHKCLNDLFGARILVQDDFSFNKISETINKMNVKNLRLHDSSNEQGYKGLHIYVGATSGHFRWELQIWHESDYCKNIELHEQYKRGYITDLKQWEEMK